MPPSSSTQAGTEGAKGILKAMLNERMNVLSIDAIDSEL